MDNLLPSLVPFRSSTGLLQNCDLPPPQVVFKPHEKDPVSAILQLIPSQPPTKVEQGGEDMELLRTGYSSMTKADPWATELGLDHGGSADLLKAMRLSQTRAREAEIEALSSKKKYEQVARLLLDESMRLRAYKRWLGLLEIEIAWLEKEERRRSTPGKRGQPGGDDEGGGAGAAWFVALALCLGIAGVGFAVRCKCLF